MRRLLNPLTAIGLITCGVAVFVPPQLQGLAAAACVFELFATILLVVWWNK